MSSLFTLPKQIPLDSGVIMPGAKLTFTETLTTTPQAVYQDADLATPHTIPVEADANGVFPQIFLDPSLPDYRVKLTTSADVLVYQIDGFPSGIGGSRTITVSSVNPYILLDDTDSGVVNEAKVKISAQGGGEFTILLVSDDEATETAAFRIFRSGTTVTGVSLIGARALTSNPAESESPDLDSFIRRKTSGTSRTNNTVSSDPDLAYTFPTSPGSLYEFTAFLIFQCASTTPGTSFAVSCNGGTSRFAANGSANAATAFADALNFASAGGTASGWTWTNTADHIASVHGQVVAPSAGNILSVAWAQTTTNASALTLAAGSFLHVKRLA